MNISEARTKEDLATVWPLLLPMVQRGLRHGQGDSLAPCDLVRAILSGDMVLWVAHDENSVYGGMVFQISQHPPRS